MLERKNSWQKTGTNSLCVGLVSLLFCFCVLLGLPSCSSSSTEQERWSMAQWHYQLLCVQGPVAQRPSMLASCPLPSNKSQLVRCTEDICHPLWELSLFCIWNFFFFLLCNLFVLQVVRKSTLYILLSKKEDSKCWLPGCLSEHLWMFKVSNWYWRFRKNKGS